MAYLGDPRHRRQNHSEVWITLYDVLNAYTCRQRRLRGLFARTPPLNPALTLNHGEKRYRPENIRLPLSIRLPGDARTKCGEGGPSQPRRLQPTDGSDAVHAGNLILAPPSCVGKGASRARACLALFGLLFSSQTHSNNGTLHRRLDGSRLRHGTTIKFVGWRLFGVGKTAGGQVRAISTTRQSATPSREIAHKKTASEKKE